MSQAFWVSVSKSTVGTRTRCHLQVTWVAFSWHRVPSRAPRRWKPRRSSCSTEWPLRRQQNEGGLFGECFHGDCWFPWDHTVFCVWALPKAHHVLACLCWLTSHHDLARTHKVSFINFRGFYKQAARSCLISTWATSSLRIWVEFPKHPCLSRLHPASRSRDETLSNWGSHYGASNPH